MSMDLLRQRKKKGINFVTTEKNNRQNKKQIKSNIKFIIEHCLPKR